MGVWIVLLLLSVARLSLAADWYIENAGSDANNCTSAAKCRTFERLIERPLSPGDNLLLKAGEIYREEPSFIVATTSGTQAAPITLSAWGNLFRHEGVHAGSAGAANLVATGRDFSASGVSAALMTRGVTLLNLTDGSTCNVTSVSTTTSTNDTLVCAMGLAGGQSNNWQVGDRYRIDNWPIVSQASLWNSGWTNEGSNVWSHVFTTHPGRMVWINGWSPHSALHNGTCSAAGMASATDRQWCAICNSGTAQSCGPGKVYVKSTSNPATRWTHPGVEVAHLVDDGQTVFQGSTRSWWIISTVAFEKSKGTLMSAIGNNITVQGLRIGWPQRHMCTSGTGCWENNSYPWMSGQDERGSEALSFGNTSAPQTGLVLSDVLLYECENNCLTFSGHNAISATITDLEIFGSIHSAINSGLSGATTATRNLILTRLNLHGNVVHWHSGATGVVHTVLVQNSLFTDAVPGAGADPRAFSRGEGRTDPYGIFLEDGGTYTHQNNLIVNNAGHGMRLKEGTHYIKNTVIRGNTNTGVNASSTARVRLNNSILADNGSSTVTTSRFQIGCQFTPCSASLFQDSASNTNKFRQPSGANFAAFSGSSCGAASNCASVSLADWRNITGGDGASVTTDDCFVDAPGLDFNLATGCDDIAAPRGPFRDITPTSSESTGATLRTTWSAGSGLPVSACDATDATVTYNAASQTTQACVAGSPSSNATTMTMGAAPGVGATVLMGGAYGLVEDSTRIGGYLNARSRAFTGHAVTNTGSGPITSGCVVGNTREIPAGSTRLLLVNACWERQEPPTPPLTFSSCTYGGQALTKVGETSVAIAGGTDPEVLASQWRLGEAGLAAATSTTLTCVPQDSSVPPNTTIDGGRPYVLSSCVYSGINQGAPILGTVRTATEPTGTTISTTALGSTSNPGVAVLLACGGNNGTWTPGAGWVKQTDAGEDGSPGTRILVADRATSGDTPAGSATFTPSQTFTNRLAMLTTALNGGEEQTPGTSPTFRQTHVAGYRARYPEGEERFCPIDGQCALAPGSQFTVRAQVEVETAPAPAAVYEWWCADNGAPFYKVSNASTGWISFAPSFRLNEPLINLLPLEGDAFVACGIHYNILTTDPGSCSTTLPGQRFEYEFSGVLSSAAVIGQQAVCRLRQAGGVALGTYTEDVEISVISPQAIGH